MFQSLDAKCANELWLLAADKFKDGGPSARQEGRNGFVREILNASLTLIHPRQRWIGSRIPSLNPAFAIAEVVWIMTGRNDSAMLNYFNPILPRYAGSEATYHGAYGHRLRVHFGIDQIGRAFDVLKNDSESRQVVLQIWDPQADLPASTGLASNPDIPCNICSMLKIRDGKLTWTQIMRSNDIFRGLPHNIVQFTMIQEILAGWLGVDLGSYNHYSDSLHFYESDGEIDDHRTDVTIPKNTDVLNASKSESDRYFQDLSRLCNQCADVGVSRLDLIRKLAALKVPQQYMNLGIVLVADALRRRGASEDAIKVLGGCSNPSLIFLFERWMAKSG